MGCGAGYINSKSYPADVLVPNWDLGKPAAFDLSVTSTLHSSVLPEVSMTAGSEAFVDENRKHMLHSRVLLEASMTVGLEAFVDENRKHAHKYNDRKCEELGWVCIPLVVETYGCWGATAVEAFSKLAGRLSTRLNQPKSKTIFGIYSRLGLALVRANRRAILSTKIFQADLWRWCHSCELQSTLRQTLSCSMYPQGRCVPVPTRDPMSHADSEHWGCDHK